MYYKLITCITIVIIFNGCEKKCKQKEYTINATIINGTTGIAYIN